MSPFFSGFADELVKVANPVTGLLKRLRHSPELRRAIGRSALLGASTGALAGALSKKNGDESRLGNALRGAATGGVTGGVTGAAFPGWFSRENHLSPDELEHLKGRGRLVRGVNAAGALASVGNLAHRLLL